MLNKLQKITSMDFLKKKDYKNSICFEYKEFIDNNEEFTEFNNSEDNEKYLDAIDKIKNIDKSAACFVEVYGEEENFIYGETIILITCLSKEEIENIFEIINKKYNDYLSPSEITLISLKDIQNTFYIDKNGKLIELCSVLRKYVLTNIFTLWWD